MMHKKLIDERRGEIVRVAAAHGAIKVRLFGSIARGEAHEGSDLDLLVTMNPGSSLFDIIAIKQDLEDLLGLSVDVVTEDALSLYLREEVLQSAVAL